MKQPQPEQKGATKGSPASTPDQALESGEPTLTGNPDEKNQRKPPEPKEGAHCESGQKH
jgi:hypothetical protein